MSGSVITIEELTGAKRRLELFGPGLPRQGANWGGRLVMTASWNPGNGSDATTHVLAPIEMPSNWEGVWRTTMLVSSPCQFAEAPGQKPKPVAIASSLRDVCESLFRSGQRLRVTWIQGSTHWAFTNRKVIREGFCEEWDFAHARADDIEWTMLWNWVGRGQKKQPAADLGKDKEAQSLKKANQELANYVGEVESLKVISANQAVPAGADSFTLGDLEAIANIPKDFAKQVKQFATNVLTRVEDLAEIIETGAGTPLLVGSTVLDIATQATRTFTQLADEMGRDIPDGYSEIEGDAAALVAAADYFIVQQDGAERLASVFAQIEFEARRRRSGIDPGQRSGDQVAAGGLLAVVLSKGESFVFLANKHYTNPDLGYVIAIANGFAENEIAPPVGTTLIIPVIDTKLLSSQI